MLHHYTVASPVHMVETDHDRRRIARGSGRTEVDVTELIGMFTSLRKQMRDMSKMLAMGAASGTA